MEISLLFDILIAWITVFSFTLFIISVISYFRTGNKRILLVSSAFLLFSIKGIILTMGLYFPEIISVRLDLPSILFDVMILLIIYFAIMRR